MSEEQAEKPQRTKEDLQKVYLQTCAETGEISFQVEALKQKLQAKWQEISSLNLEAQELQKSQPTELKDVSNGQTQV